MFRKLRAETERENGEENRLMFDNRALFALLLPIIIEQILNSFMGMVDTVMVSNVGSAAISAVSLVDSINNLVIQVFSAMAAGAAIVCSRFIGAKDRNGCNRAARQVVLTVFIISMAIMVFGLIFRVPLLRVVFGAIEPEVMENAMIYFMITVVSYPFLALFNAGAAFFRAESNAKLPMFVAAGTNILNIAGNAVFIFGMNMGVAGAACATLIARCIELILVLGYVYGKKLALACGPRGMFGWSKSFIFRFVETSAPVIANEFMWGLGTTMYSLAYGRMGDDAVAAITIATTIQDIAVVLFQGLSAATAVILGHELGAGHIKQAEKYATQFFILQFLVTVTADILLVLGRWKIIGIYNITPQVAQDVNRCLLVFALYMPAKMFNYVNVVGVLRSGGDTKMCLFLDTSGV